jgi:hypothetical protein
LRATVDVRDILDREAQALGEDWPAFWTGVEHAGTLRAQLARLDHERMQHQQQADRLRQELRDAVHRPGRVPAA